MTLHSMQEMVLGLLRLGINAGNAPVMIHRSNLELIVEDWYDIALRMKNDERANKAFGWILEMVRMCLGTFRLACYSPCPIVGVLDEAFYCGCAVCVCNRIFSGSQRPTGVQAAW